MNATLNNKVIIVTGASSGIGLASARLFAERGNKVIFAARDEEKISTIIYELRKKGHKAAFVKTDVRFEEDCNNLVKKTIEIFGSPDILINNAGISMRALFHETKASVIRDLMDTNFWGTVHCTRYALPHLVRNKGSVVFISSVTGKVPLPARTGYCASKYAAEGFLEALRLENLENGLHVMVARPGFTKTRIRERALDKNGLPQGESPRDEEKMMSAEQVAGYIYTGIQKRTREFNLTREGKFSIWLYKFFPGIADRLIYKFISKEPDSPLQKAIKLKRKEEAEAELTLIRKSA